MVLMIGRRLGLRIVVSLSLELSSRIVVLERSFVIRCRVDSVFSSKLKLK